MTQTDDVRARLDLALKLADAARSETLPRFRNLDAVDGKSGNRPGFDPVTAADREAERVIRELLETHAPDDAIVGEEFGEKSGQSGWTWYLDPVDGTRAFVAGLPVWTTLIAATDPNGTPVIGIIDQPVLEERYIGWPGGARLDAGDTSIPLTVSRCTDLREATIATTDPFILTPAEQGAWTHLRHTARLTRYGLDAYAYGRLAGGTIDLVAETGLAAWDMAALIPVVRGAGGVAFNWRGEAPKLGGQLVCASTQAVLDQALISLRRSAED